MSNLDDYMEVGYIDGTELFYYLNNGIVKNTCVEMFENLLIHYINFGLHFGVPKEFNQGSVLFWLRMRAREWEQELITITNDGTRLSYVPLDDTMEETVSSTGSHKAMQEDSPVNASYDITTPIGKQKGESTSIANREVKHDTVREAVARAEFMRKYGATIGNICHAILDPLIYELNSAY